IDPSLRSAVRLRIAGERGPLPAPALAGYLAGLLVLLGMLGTLLGMMATLRGTGIALETASDLQAIRDSLAAPVKGLGFAFGTSIAGVASSAALGLLAALCRRERGEAGRMLDAAIAGPLHVLTPAHRRDEAFELMRRQVEAMPALVDRLQAMAEAVERREATHLQLADSVRQSLHDSVARGAEAASSALQPVMQATMADIANATGALQQALGEAVQRHLRDSAAGLQSSTEAIAGLWTQALE